MTWPGDGIIGLWQRTRVIANENNQRNRPPTEIFIGGGRIKRARGSGGR